MKVAGIIAEYNPFHNGHLYQIECLRQMGFDYIVVAMSGDFVQRGYPAIIDKYARTEMALASGADCVLELPTLYATASAEYFAKGGVALLEGFGPVTHLCFGAECDNLALLQEIAQFLNHPTKEYEMLLTTFQKEGLSFPLARAKALSCSLSEGFCSKEDLLEVLSSPNNILAIEYLRFTHLTPVLIKREGASYHDTELSELASASGIRQALFQGKKTVTAMPETAFSILNTYRESAPLLREDSLSSILGYQFLLYKNSMSQGQSFIQFADCSKDLSAKIEKNLPNYESFSQFVALLNSKDLTSTRISRVLCHIALSITEKDYELISCAEYKENLYARVLGFRKEASPLLSEAKKKASVPLLTKVADASHILSNNQALLFEKDLFASDFYNQLIIANNGSKKPNDYTRQLIMP